jgi:hypothetical protein
VCLLPDFFKGRFQSDNPQGGSGNQAEFLSDQAILLYFMKKSAKNGHFSVLGNTFPVNSAD